MIDTKELALKCWKETPDATTESIIDSHLRFLAAYLAEQKPVAWKDTVYGNLHHSAYGEKVGYIPLFPAPPEPAPNLYREIYEVWAGSEGIPIPRTAPEAYLLGLLEQMVDIAKTGMHMTEPASQTRSTNT